MQFRVPVFTSVLIIVIAACQKPDSIADGANSVTSMSIPESRATLTPEGAPPENAVSSPVAPLPTAETAIPNILQGRWGLTPADCTTALGEAKGLLVVNARELRFHESLAIPSEAIQSDNQSMSGNFRFSGEGKAWSRFESLKRNGDKLTRTETDPAASYTYAKC